VPDRSSASIARAALLAAALVFVSGASPAATTTTAAPSADEAAFRDLYRELVEINTTLSVGSCTKAAEAMARRLQAAGIPADAMQVLAPPQRPQDGNLIATLEGRDKTLKPLLLLAHIDVVEAKAEDWGRDPFKLIEQDGFFYARGASDDKAMASVFTDSLIRYRKEGFKPLRSIRLALTCGEESPSVFNGVKWLLETHPDVLQARFGLNEGAAGLLDAAGKPVSLDIQAGEKTYQDYTLKTTNPGGHSSRPSKTNAINQLAAGLLRLAAYQFPSPSTTRRARISNSRRSFSRRRSPMRCARCSPIRGRPTQPSVFGR
jgi:acetylornithine deacetylase/succinyl-diaminopimelate desuccinylase-like protein